MQATSTDAHGRAGSPVPGFKPTSAPPAFEAPLSVPVFSRRREVLVGRVAMAGFYSACMWEVSSMLVASASVTTAAIRMQTNNDSCGTGEPAASWLLGL